MHELIETLDRFLEAHSSALQIDSEEGRQQAQRRWREIVRDFWPTHRFPEEAFRAVADPALAWAAQRGRSDPVSVAAIENGASAVVELARKVAVLVSPTVYANKEEAWPQWERVGLRLEELRVVLNDLRRIAAVCGEPWIKREQAIASARAPVREASTVAPPAGAALDSAGAAPVDLEPAAERNDVGSSSDEPPLVPLDLRGVAAAARALEEMIVAAPDDSHLRAAQEHAESINRRREELRAQLSPTDPLWRGSFNRNVEDPLLPSTLRRALREAWEAIVRDDRLPPPYLLEQRDAWLNALDELARACEQQDVHDGKRGLSNVVTSSDPLVTRWADPISNTQPAADIDKEALAIAFLLKHPDWSIEQIATELGVNRRTPYKWRKFRSAADKAGKLKPRGSKQYSMPRGHKTSDGQIEAYSDEDEDE